MKKKDVMHLQEVSVLRKTASRDKSVMCLLLYIEPGQRIKKENVGRGTKWANAIGEWGTGEGGVGMPEYDGGGRASQLTLHHVHTQGCHKEAWT